MKTEWVNRIAMGIGLIVAALIYVAIVQWLHWVGWLVEIGWLLLLQVFFDQRIRHKKRAHFRIKLATVSKFFGQ